MSAAQSRVVQASTAKEQFPALTFDPADAALLRRRRCTACHAVREHFLASPPLPTCEASTRLHIQLPRCPELPKPAPPKPNKAALAALKKAKAKRRAGAPTAAATGSPHDTTMASLQRIMDAAHGLAEGLIDDAADAAAAAAIAARSAAAPAAAATQPDPTCRKPPRQTAETGACAAAGAPGYTLAAYALCFMRAARGRLSCSRSAVVPALGAPPSLLPTLLPALLPDRVVIVEVHLHESVIQTMKAGGSAGFDDGTGPQVDLWWDVVDHEGLMTAIDELEV